MGGDLNRPRPPLGIEFVPLVAAPAQILLLGGLLQVVEGRQEPFSVFPAGRAIADVGNEVGVAGLGIQAPPEGLDVTVDDLEGAFAPEIRAVGAEPSAEGNIRHIDMPEPVREGAIMTTNG